MFCKADKAYLVPVIEEYIVTTSEPEDNMPVNVIPDEEEIVRPNEISEQLSELTYHNKDPDPDTDTSAYK